MERSLAIEAAGLAARWGLRAADAFYGTVAGTLKLPLITLDDDQRSQALIMLCGSPVRMMQTLPSMQPALFGHRTAE